MTANLLMAVCLVAMTLAGIMMVRNGRVLRFRLSLLAQVSARAQQDIRLGRSWQWRYDRMNSVTYEAMLFDLRRLRVENYYDDLSFLREPILSTVTS